MIKLIYIYLDFLKRSTIRNGWSILEDGSFLEGVMDIVCNGVCSSYRRLLPESVPINRCLGKATVMFTIPYGGDQYPSSEGCKLKGFNFFSFFLKRNQGVTVAVTITYAIDLSLSLSLSLSLCLLVWQVMMGHLPMWPAESRYGQIPTDDCPMLLIPPFKSRHPTANLQPDHDPLSQGRVLHHNYWIQEVNS
jgi:hypothetical protein